MNPAVKNFFKGVLRIATAILLVVIIVGGAIWGVKSWLSYREQSRNASLALPLEWLRITDSGPGTTEFALKTIWRDGWLSYVFEVEKYAGSQAKDTWLLQFTDGHGFEVFKIHIRDQTRILERDDSAIGYVAKGRMLLSADEYRRAKHWEVSWLD